MYIIKCRFNTRITIVNITQKLHRGKSVYFCYALILLRFICCAFMEVKMNRNKLAFSLVEILVALIIVSLIVAALAPVITKKLSSAGITIVGGGSGGGPGAASGASCGDGTYWDEELKYCKVCSYKTPHCIDCNETNGVCSVCEDGYRIDENNQCVETNARSCGDAAMKVVLNGVTYCMTKYNIGDHGSLPVASGTYLAVAGGVECPSGSLCCWQGTTASPCNSANGEYSGCGRTACNYNAAKASCKELTYNNMLWRLPNADELTSLASQINTYSKNQGNNGLMLCDASSGYGSSQCASYGNCKGVSDSSACRLSNIWGQESSSTQANYFQFVSGILSSNSSYYHYGWSTRCVSPLGECNSGEFYDIDELTCKACKEKTLNCKNCNKRGECTVCEDGYTLDPTTKICYEDICGKYALKVNLGGQDYCFAKYNIGDNIAWPVSGAASILYYSTSTCASLSNQCTWQHSETAGACNNNNGSYSGCSRTLVNYFAAIESCKNSTYQGLSWRLPTRDEYSKLGEIAVEKTVNKGDSGLMLCTSELVDGYARCEDIGGTCKETSNLNRCFSRNYWVQEAYSSASAYTWSFYPEIMSITNNNKSNAFSARCIAPIIDCGDGYYSDNTSLSCKTCDTKTLHCAKCNKRTGECSACKNGYTYNPSTKLCEDNICGDLAIRVELDGKEMCMTKYNIGDGPEDGEKLPIASSVSQRYANSTMTCDITNDKCSWSGTTASTGCGKGNEEYSGCTRTVMNWTAANDSCNALSYRGLSWRLPTGEELNDLKAQINLYVINKGTSGLMLCAHEYYNGSLCPHKRIQVDTSYMQTTIDAFPTELWGSVANNSQYYNFRFQSTFADVQTRPNEYAFSVRCVAPILTCNSDEYADSISGSCKKCSSKTPNCKECTLANGECSACQDGYELKDGECVYKTSHGEPRYPMDCYRYNAVFIPKKYNGSLGKNICVTRRNVADSGGPETYSSTRIFTIGLNDASWASSVGSANVCYKGQTSTSCLNYGATRAYDSCNRAVCGYWAAYAACVAHSLGGSTSGVWHLPSYEILNGWKSAYTSGDTEMIDIIDNQLELCNGKTNGLTCGANNVCLGNTNSNWCSAHAIWGGAYTAPYALILEGGGSMSLVGQGSNLGQSLSTRCYTADVLLD